MPTDFTLAGFLGTIEDIIEFVFGLVGDTVGAIVSNPVLTFAFVLPLAGIGIGIVTRLLNTRM